MSANKSSPQAPADEVRERCALGSEFCSCEKALYNLATDLKASSALRLVDQLCPTYQHKLRELLTTVGLRS